MYPRTNYEMTEEDLKTILEACKPVPAIMLHICGGPRSPQENANDAWAALGKKMGFDYMTVQPSNKGNRFFTAVPSETELQRNERLETQAEANRQREIETLRAEISERQTKLEAALAKVRP